ncbi:MAG: hypothetical protein HFJ02_05515 [Bacilli bacterium]|nr:hypothetical protein [Bacilli bacterium]
MDLLLQQKLETDKKMQELLKRNSYWFKELNRNSENYKEFLNAMKEKYHLKVTDKISDTIDNIDLISGILESLK